jgi:hypothetical protein
MLLVQAAKQPDHQNDRKWNADQPKQESSAHFFLQHYCSKLLFVRQTNGGTAKMFRSFEVQVPATIAATSR